MHQNINIQHVCAGIAPQLYVGVESTQTRLLAINKTCTNKNTATWDAHVALSTLVCSWVADGGGAGPPRDGLWRDRSAAPTRRQLPPPRASAPRTPYKHTDLSLSLNMIYHPIWLNDLPSQVRYVDVHRPIEYALFLSSRSAHDTCSKKKICPWYTTHLIKRPA
jgi:hypothetical protein